MTNLHKIKKLITKKYYLFIAVILFFSVFSTFLEIVSISILVPFFSNLSEGFEFKNQSFIELNNFYEKYLSNDIFIILILIIIIFLVKNLIYLFARFIEQKFTYRFHRYVTKNLFNYYLNKDFDFHNQNNSSNLIKNITAECNILTFNLIQPLLLSFSELIVLLFLLSFLFYINFYTTLSVIIFLIIISGLFNLISRNFLRKLGVKRNKHSGLALKELQQAFAAIREVSIYKAQNYFAEKFDLHNKINLDTGFKSKFIYTIPKSVIEMSVILGVLSIIYFLKTKGILFTEIVLITSIYVLAAAKIMPGVIRIFSVIVNLNYTKNSLKIFDKKFFTFLNKNNEYLNSSNKKIKLHSLDLRNLSFKYDDKYILKNINLKLVKNDRIGIIGSSGSGKTTLINIITGLIKNYKGNYLINNKLSENQIVQFQNSLGYVPQNSLTMDETIKENILLGRKDTKKKIYKKILKDLDLTKLNSTKSKGYSQQIGERGARVSGGQNQRIGIARALLDSPSVLILDESLNSIDKKIKFKILNNLFKKYSRDLIIVISHNKEDLKYCNKKFELKNGVLKRI
jgi:ATP-binding cassette, subfamily B, bacterial PglK